MKLQARNFVVRKPETIDITMFFKKFCIATRTKKGQRPTGALPGCRKTMLQKKDNRAAGELEGAKAPLEIGLIAIKNA